MSVAFGSGPLLMYGSVAGILSRRDSLTPKFLATIDFGVWFNQSSTLKVVPKASKFPA